MFDIFYSMKRDCDQAFDGCIIDALPFTTTLRAVTHVVLNHFFTLHFPRLLIRRWLDAAAADDHALGEADARQHRQQRCAARTDERQRESRHG